MDYKILKAYSSDMLELDVRVHIDKGYEPHGSLVVTVNGIDTIFYQPVIKGE